MIEFETFNLLEGIFWISLGIISLVLSKVLSERYGNILLCAGLTLILFGVSDFIEIKTGAFWIPWWLLVWNVVCIIGFIIIFIWYVNIRKRSD